MTRKMMTQAGGLEIEDGTYTVRLESLEDTEGEWEGKKNQLLKWNFRLPDVPDEDGEPSKYSDLSSLTLTPKSKLWARYQAFTGVSLDLDIEIDLEDMVGKEAQASFVHKTAKGDPSVYPRIESIIPLPKAGKAPKPKAATAPTDPYEGFRKANSDIDWALFWAECGRHDVTLVDVARFINVSQVTPKAIRRWLETQPDRTLGGLIADVVAVMGTGVDPDELPFE
jgi:hypothetical protein